MKGYYTMPITNEYETRGCKVVIDAASSANSVDISVYNKKSGIGSIHHHVLMNGNTKGYSKHDMTEIKGVLDNLLDTYGDEQCNKIHYTNQILS